LPKEVQALIVTVVKRSRLMRFEKLEVVQELIAHFTDGELAGQTCRQLVEQFGDPRVTAQLIRRSKLRNRPIMFKALQICGWCFLGLASIYLAISAYFYAGAPTPNVDYLRDLNRPISETAERDKAWPIYRPLWIKYGFSEGGGFNEQMRELYAWTVNEHGDRQQRGLVKPEDPEWPEAIARLQQWSDLLEGFRQGARRPKLGLELQADISKYSEEDRFAIFPHLKPGEDSNWWSKQTSPDKQLDQLMAGSLVGILLPHIQSFRNAARIFQVDTRWAIEQHDSHRALENIETVMGLARQVSDSKILVCSLVGFAVQETAVQMLEETLAGSPDFFDDQQLSRLQRLMEDIDYRNWIRFDGERAMFYDMVQRVFTDDGKGNGRITPVGIRFLSSGLYLGRSVFEHADIPEYQGLSEAIHYVVAPASMLMVASREETVATYEFWLNRIEKDLELPLWQSSDLGTEFQHFIEKNGIAHAVLGFVFPAYSSLRKASDRMIGRQEAVIASLAMHRYFLKHGQWPDSFEQLSPEFVTEFPIDVITGDFIKFKIGDSGPIIYSVGNDRDDDGGQPIYWESPQGAVRTLHFIPGEKPEKDGDAILWPSSY
jgi:hypothetical protein